MKRPRAFIVMGVVNLLFACGWAFNSFSALVLLAFSPGFFENNNPFGADLSPVRATYTALEAPLFKVYWVANGSLGLVAAGVLAAGGVGLLMMRPWGRRLSLTWAVYAVLAGAVTIGMTQGYLVPALASEMGEPLPTSAENIVGIGASLVVRWAYPVLLMVLLPQAFVATAFEHARQRRSQRAAHDSAPTQATPAAPPGYTTAADQPMRRNAPVQAEPAAPVAAAHAASSAQRPAAPQHQPSAAQRTWRDDPWNDPDVT